MGKLVPMLYAIITAPRIILSVTSGYQTIKIYVNIGNILYDEEIYQTINIFIFALTISNQTASNVILK